jgi:hypothetical protein
MTNEFSKLVKLAENELNAFRKQVSNDLKRLGLIRLSNIINPIKNKVKV